MRKILTLLAVTAIILTSCTGVRTLSPERLKLDKSYKFVADIQYGEFNAVARFERSLAHMWEISLLEPFALEGIVFTYDNGEITAQLDELQMQYVPDNAQDLGDVQAPYKRIIDSFENAINGEGREVISSGEEITITSKAGSPPVSYTLVLAKDSYEPISLTIPASPSISGGAVNVRFSEVQVSQIVQVIVPEMLAEMN